MKFLLVFVVASSFLSATLAKGIYLKPIKAGDTIFLCNINCSKNCPEPTGTLYCDSLAILNNEWTITVENKVIVNSEDYSSIKALLNSDTTYMPEYRIGKTIYASGELASIYSPQLVLVIKRSKFTEQYAFDTHAHKYRYYKIDRNGKCKRSKVINYYWIEDQFNEILKRNGLQCL